MNDEDDSDRKSAKAAKNVVFRLAKWLIAALVVFGLYRTVRSAFIQLEEQHVSIRQKVADLDQEISETQVGEKRAVLEGEKAALLKQLPELAEIHWGLVAIAAPVYFLSLLPPAFFFHQTLVHMQQRPRLIDSVGGHVLGHVGKYVPGKAMVVVLRVAAVTNENVRGAVATVAVFVETLVMMAVGGTIAGCLMLSLEMPMWIRILAVGLAVCAAVPTLPPLFRLWLIVLRK